MEFIKGLGSSRWSTKQLLSTSTEDDHQSALLISAVFPTIYSASDHFTLYLLNLPNHCCICLEIGSLSSSSLPFSLPCVRTHLRVCLKHLTAFAYEPDLLSILFQCSASPLRLLYSLPEPGSHTMWLLLCGSIKPCTYWYSSPSV